MDDRSSHPRWRNLLEPAQARPAASGVCPPVLPDPFLTRRLACAGLPPGNEMITVYGRSHHPVCDPPHNMNTQVHPRQAGMLRWMYMLHRTKGADQR